MNQERKFSKKKQILFYLITFTIIIVGTLVVGEISSRVWTYFKNPITKKPDKIRYTYSPYLPYIPTPYYYDKNKGIYLNSRGFRNSYEFETPKPAKVYRIVCLGGSTTYSDYDNATNEQIWSGRLEYYLNKNSKNIKFEVINASAHNYTAYMNFIDYLTRVRDLEVDMIIIYEGINELYFNGFTDSNFAHYNAFKIFNPDYYNSLIYNMNHNFLLRHSDLLKRLYNMLFIKNISLNVMATKEVHYNAKKNIENMKNNSLQTFKKALTGFIGISKVDNAKLVFLSQAYQYSKIKAALLAFNKDFSQKEVNSYISETKRVANLMEKTAAKYNITYLDMNKVLDQKKEYFFNNPLDAVHFSIKGDDYFAKQLYDNIENLFNKNQ